jgi:membrane-associated HD superfamily phosphohydrolase
MIEDKASEGQLENSGISSNDLLKVKDSLVETLGSIYHQRILS